MIYYIHANSVILECFYSMYCIGYAAERILRYKSFCLQVRMTYMNLSDMGLSQDEIFEKMVD